MPSRHEINDRVFVFDRINSHIAKLVLSFTLGDDVLWVTHAIISENAKPHAKHLITYRDDQLFAPHEMNEAIVDQLHLRNFAINSDHGFALYEAFLFAGEHAFNVLMNAGKEVSLESWIQYILDRYDQKYQPDPKAFGLYNKYVVYNQSGELVDGCFVLKPGSDHHARRALRTYAESVRIDNRELSWELINWMSELDKKDSTP